MARSPSPRGRKDNTAGRETAKLSIDIDEFTRMRDAYISGLATIENAAHDLSRRFITHTNELIGKGNISQIDLYNLANPLGDNGLLTRGRVATPGPRTEAGGKKPKRPHDKNAPKKAMTPFFLFMQTMRPIIQKEMGPDYKSKEVELEGQKRWKAISKSEKDAVEYKYACNRAAYYEKMKAYKAGLPIPEINQAQAEKFYEQQQKEGFIAKPVSTPPLDESDDSDSSTSDEEDARSPSPRKAPSPPKSPRASKRRKTTKDGGEKLSSSIKVAPPKEIEKPKPASESPVVERSSRSPEKERKKGRPKILRDRDAEAATSIVTESSPLKATGQDTQKAEKRKGRKRKSEAVIEED